jgi:uncharacterized protein YkwD
MLTTFALCASLLLPLAETEKTVEKSPSTTEAKVEKTAPVEKTAEKSVEKKEEKAADGKTVEKKEQEKAADEKTTDKTVDKSTEKTPETKKEKDEELLQIEANVVSYTNNERARYGLPPLQVDKQLMKTAREHCSWMTWNRIFQHTRRPVAENIAMGQPSSQDVVRTWMNSSGHRANILNPNHRHIGVGAYRTESGTIYWVQQFSQ